MCADHVRYAARPVYVRAGNTITFLHTMLQFVVGGTKNVPINFKGNIFAGEAWPASWQEATYVNTSVRRRVTRVTSTYVYTDIEFFNHFIFFVISPWIFTVQEPMTTH